MKTIAILSALFLICTQAFQIDLIAGGFNGDGEIITGVSLSVLSPVMDSNDNIYYRDYVGSVRVINASTHQLSTFQPQPWIFCSALFITNNTLFVADDTGCRIFTIDLATKVVSIFAGNGTCVDSGDEGLAVDASISAPTAISQVTDGTIFCYVRSKIRMIDSSGIITTVSGSFPPAFYLAPIPTAPQAFIFRRFSRIDIVNGTATIGNPYVFSGVNNDTAEGLPVQDVLFNSYFASIDTFGNVYAAEVDRIRIIDTNLTVFTIAGNRTLGTNYTGDGGLATEATLNTPDAVLVDSHGNIFVVDQLDVVIRKINKNTKVISTYAGNGFFSYSGDGKSAKQAQLNAPFSAIEDLEGNILIADTFNFAIRQVSPSGVISTIAGNGKDGASPDGTLATSAVFGEIDSILVAKNGDIFFTEASRVRKIVKSTGKIVTVAGTTTRGSSSGDGGLATNAVFSSPFSLAFDLQENLYICDSNNLNVRVVNHATGIINAFADIDCFYLHFCAVDGNLYVSDINDGIINVVNSKGNVTIFAGNGTRANSTDGLIATDSPFNLPAGITSDWEGNIYVMEQFFVKKIDAKTRVISTVYERPLVNVFDIYGGIFYSLKSNSLIITDVILGTVSRITGLPRLPPIASSVAKLSLMWILLMPIILIMFV